MSEPTFANQELGAVTGRVNFLQEMAGKPAYFMDQPPSSPKHRRPLGPQDLLIESGRPFASALSLDREGFALVSHQSAVPDFYDSEAVSENYYPEVEELVLKATGATRVHVFDHNVRCDPKEERGEDGARSPVRYAHNDYTLRSGPQRVRDLLGDEADRLLGYRFAIVNVWRPIRGPVLDAPIAVCDAQTMQLADFVATDLCYPDRTGEIYSVRHSPGHHWYYFPEMQADEALLLKCFDSSEDGRARFTAHTAFEDPTTPADAPPRESIEARTLVFFAPEEGAHV